MTRKAPADLLVEQLLVARDTDAQSVCERFDRLIESNGPLERRVGTKRYCALMDYLRSLPAPGIEVQERVGRMLYSLNHGNMWREVTGDDGSLSDLFERDLDGAHGYGWANAIARAKPYMVLNTADLVAFGQHPEEVRLAEQLDQYLGSDACWPSVRGRVGALSVRQLHQFLDDTVLYYNRRLNVPRRSQRHYINRLAKCRLSDGMLKIGSRKTRETLWVLNALARQMSDGQAKRWARLPIIRCAETMQREGCSYIDQLRGRLVRQSLAKTSRRAGKSNVAARRRSPRI